MIMKVSRLLTLSLIIALSHQAFANAQEEYSSLTEAARAGLSGVIASTGNAVSPIVALLPREGRMADVVRLLSVASHQILTNPSITDHEKALFIVGQIVGILAVWETASSLIGSDYKLLRTIGGAGVFLSALPFWSSLETLLGRKAKAPLGFEREQEY
jgi:hypothetical protein